MENILIKYDLKCDNGHLFEGWFPSSAGFEKQEKQGLVTCPTCASANVKRALVAPAVKRANIEKNNSKKYQLSSKENDLKTYIRTLNKLVEKNTTDVGKDFAKEA